MTTWVMILLIMGHRAGGPAIAVFHDQASCQAAGNAAVDKFGRWYSIGFVCVPSKNGDASVLVPQAR